jgi:hypothetical protein
VILCVTIDRSHAAFLAEFLDQRFNANSDVRCQEEGNSALDLRHAFVKHALTASIAISANHGVSALAPRSDWRDEMAVPHSGMQ